MLRRLRRLFRGDARAPSPAAPPPDPGDLVSVFDTTVCDNNLGNAIIMDAVYGHLKAMFPDHFFIALPYLDSIGRESTRYIEKSEHVFFGGTNSLCSEMETYSQWGVDAGNVEHIRDVVLMGVGWWQYQGPLSPYTAGLLRKVLHPTRLHSVRDAYSEAKLREAGFPNVLNTSCPTTWDLDEAHCRQIPTRKAENVLLTFTNYAQRPETDRALLEVLKRHYRRIFVWVQGPEDRDYARAFSADLELLAPRKESLERLLASDLDLDYVGTRLHAGIKALQLKRRAIIVATDNRATEIGRDIGLEVVPRDDVARIEARLASEFETRLRLPHDAIRAWKSQFARGRPG